MSRSKGHERAAATAHAPASAGIKDEEEIAEELGLAGVDAAKRLVHAAILRLRRHFAPTQTISSGARDEVPPDAV